MRATGWSRVIRGVTATVLMAGAMVQSAVADLFVVRVGDGAAALTSASTAASVVKFDNSGGLLSTINLPTAAAGANLPLTMSGTATSEGFINISTNGQFLTVGGYAVAPGVASVATTTAAAAPRGVARIAAGAGAVNTTTAFSGDSSFSGSNIRSAITTNGTDLWIAGNASGSNGGVRYTTLGGTTSTALTNAAGDALANARVVSIFNGQLYVSSSSAPTGNDFRGVNSVGNGLPTTGMQAVTLLFPVGVNRSSNDFWFKDASTLYVADDGSAANGGGIQKWTESGGAWTLAYTLLNTGATTTAVRGLSGTVIGGNAILYATTTQTSANNLITVIDSGAGATAITLATAPVNTAFRGVEFVGDVTPPTNNADFDNDGDVDGADFLTWQRGLGLTGQPGKSTGDADGNGLVNGVDLAFWKSQFGTPAVQAVGAVPEPATVLLAGLGIAACGLAGRGRLR